MKEIGRTIFNLLTQLRDDRAVNTLSKVVTDCTITVKRLKSNTITIKLVPKS